MSLKADVLSFFRKCRARTREMVYQVRNALTTKPDVLSSVPQTHMVEGKAQLLNLYTCVMLCTHLDTYMYTPRNK